MKVIISQVCYEWAFGNYLVLSRRTNLLSFCLTLKLNLYASWRRHEMNQKWLFVCTGKLKISCWAFPDGHLLQFLEPNLSRSWSFRIMTWTRNAKLTRLIRFISFKIWHRYAPRNATRNATSFWNSRYIQKITSGSHHGDFLTRIDWA